MSTIRFASSPASEYLFATVQGMMMMGCGAPMAETSCFPPYVSEKPVVESSDLTYNLPSPPTVSRKRLREYSAIDHSPLVSSFPGIAAPNNASVVGVVPLSTAGNRKTPGDSDFDFSSLGDDVSLHVLKQHMEIDSFISQHIEAVREETSERRRIQSLRLLAMIEAGAAMRLRAKEDELEKMIRLNTALDERVRSLFMENQIWKELAYTTEATAIALQTSLNHHHSQCLDAVHKVMDDSQSHCGSNDDDVPGMEVNSVSNSGTDKAKKTKMDDCDRWWCRNCGKEEAAVLLLPCRHLCLCTSCGSSIHVCPTCHTHKTGSVHVNLSS